RITIAERRGKTMRWGTQVLTMTLVFGAPSALAQTIDRPAGQPGVDVYAPLNPRPPASALTQPAPGYTGQPVTSIGPYPPVGIPVGSVIVYPSITGAAFFDDNVFAT